MAKVVKVQQASATAYKSTKEFDRLVAAAEAVAGMQPSTTTSFEHYSIQTGSRSLDAISGGGFPYRRISSPFGPERSGKTTLALETSATALLQWVPVFFLDHEQAVDVKYASNIFRKRGIDDTSFLVGNKKSPLYRLWKFYQPDTSEQTGAFLYTLLRSLPKEPPGPNLRALIIIDSAANIMSLKSMESNSPNEGQAARSRMFAEMLPKLKALVSKRNVVLLILNQIRERPGVIMGSPEYEPGGNALKHNTDFRIRISGSSAKETKEGGFQPIQSYLRVKKNKVFVPFIKSETGIKVGTGIDVAVDLLEYFRVTDQLSNGRISSAKDKRLKKFAGLGIKEIRKKMRSLCEIVDDQIQSKMCFDWVLEHFKFDLDEFGTKDSDADEIPTEKRRSPKSGKKNSKPIRYKG